MEVKGQEGQAQQRIPSSSLKILLFTPTLHLPRIIRRQTGPQGLWGDAQNPRVYEGQTQKAGSKEKQLLSSTQGSGRWS